jgi:hypothetical protein
MDEVSRIEPASECLPQSPEVFHTLQSVKTFPHHTKASTFAMHCAWLARRF